MTVSQAQLRYEFQKIQQELSSGTYDGSADIIEYSLYDRADMVSTRVQHRMFQSGVGQNDPDGNIKTLADTNVQGALGIPKGSKLQIQAIKFFYTHVTAVTAATLILIQQMIEQSTLTFRVTGKDNLGLWKLNEIIGVPIQAAISDAVTVNTSQASNGRYLGIYPLNLPLILAEQVQFEVLVDHHVAPNVALNADFLTVSLCGILMRQS